MFLNTNCFSSSQWFERQEKSMSNFLEGQRQLKMAKDGGTQADKWMKAVSVPLANVLENAKVDLGFAGKILAEFVPIVYKYAGRDYDQEMALDRARMQHPPPPATPCGSDSRPPQSPHRRQLDLQEQGTSAFAARTSTPKDTSASNASFAGNITLASLFNMLNSK